MTNEFRPYAVDYAGLVIEVDGPDMLWEDHFGISACSIEEMRAAIDAKIDDERHLDACYYADAIDEMLVDEA